MSVQFKFGDLTDIFDEAVKESGEVRGIKGA